MLRCSRGLNVGPRANTINIDIGPLTNTITQSLDCIQQLDGNTTIGICKPIYCEISVEIE